MLPQLGFRTPKPVHPIQGEWITADRWTASTYLTGRHPLHSGIPACIDATRALHSALRHIPQHHFLKDNKTPWGLADRWCWGEKRVRIQPQLHHLIDRLNELREPIPVFEKQLIHGDLNPENILIAPDTDPAIFDFSPFWGPPDFVLVIFANFIGPRQGYLEALKHFRHIQFFDQLLVRAAIRMLLVMAVIDHLEDWQTCPEKQASEMIITYVP